MQSETFWPTECVCFGLTFPVLGLRAHKANGAAAAATTASVYDRDGVGYTSSSAVAAECVCVCATDLRRTTPRLRRFRNNDRESERVCVFARERVSQIV